MQWVKTIDYRRIGFILLFCIGFLITRLPGLAAHTVNPDAVNWHYRSQQFFVGLKSGQFEKTYQHYHPGVTLMWVVGTGIEFVKQVTGIDTYTHLNFELFHFSAKFILVFFQLILSILLIYFLSSSLNFYKACLIVSLFTFEPFFVGNSRLLHMDVLFTLLIFMTLVLAYNGDYLLAGIFAAFSFLTRSIGIGVFLYVIGMAILQNLQTKSLENLFRKILVFSSVFLVVTFVFFPALWVRPISIISDIFSEGQRIGIRSGHGQIFMGKYTHNPGIFFYPIVILLKSSPFILLGLVSYFIYFASTLKSKSLFKNKKFGIVLYLGLFYLGYFLIMSWPTKKIDRYMITIFPFLATLSVIGLYKIKRSLLSNILILTCYLVFVVYPLVKIYPYYFTYTSIPPTIANNIIGQKSFGVGILDLKDFILDNYGQVNLGFIDTKPIKSVYPNSKIFDMRIDGTSNYDLAVLAINENFPKESIGLQFIRDSVIKINGLDYWRIYVKKDRL